MTATDLPGLIECAAGKNGYERFRTWVVAQAIRNALQAFHGDSAFDPDDPGSGAGFISDRQMRFVQVHVSKLHALYQRTSLRCLIPEELCAALFDLPMCPR